MYNLFLESGSKIHERVRDNKDAIRSEGGDPENVFYYTESMIEAKYHAIQAEIKIAEVEEDREDNETSDVGTKIRKSLEEYEKAIDYLQNAVSLHEEMNPESIEYCEKLLELELVRLSERETNKERYEELFNRLKRFLGVKNDYTGDVGLGGYKPFRKNPEKHLKNIKYERDEVKLIANEL